jgi:hypothetical protein
MTRSGMPGLTVALGLLFMVCSLTSFAQLKLYPAIKAPQEFGYLAHSEDIIPVDTINLPFWEDFSSGKLRQGLWHPASNIWINFGMAIQPPTLGVATFDGLDKEGKPYSLTPQTFGFGDSLLSLPINLSNVILDERNTVFISFFWQKQGKGEAPDPEDFLELRFKDVNGIWTTVWSVNGSVDAPRTQFKLENIAINQNRYFHAGFQFMFRSASKLSGPFDTWNLDYIFLDKNRKSTEKSFLDRSISTPPASIFGRYNLIPTDLLQQYASSFSDTTRFEIYNLDSLLQPVEYSSLIRDKKSGTVLQQMNTDDVVVPLLQGFERRSLKAFPINTQRIPQRDTVQLSYELSIKSGDTFYRRPGGPPMEQVDFRSNDTFKKEITLSNVLAYDDGESEFAAGLNQNGAQVAIKFTLPAEDVLSAIDLHFPFIPGSQSGRSMELRVFRRLASGSENIVYTQTITVPPYEGRDEFTRFQLNRPVVLSDTFYIGWRHIGVFPVALGLDKDNNTNDRIFVNVNGTWDNAKTIEGSLMLRPVLDKGVATSEPKQSENGLFSIYPNPATGIVYASGEFQVLEIIDLNGRIVYKSKNLDLIKGIHSIDLQHLPKGIYLVRAFYPKFVQTRKLLLH